MSGQNENKRESFRASTDLNATLKSKGDKLSAKIIDLSAGGLKIKTNKNFLVGEKVTVDFLLNDDRFSKTCRVAYAKPGEDAVYTLGCKFEYVNTADLKKISSYAFSIQAQARSS